MLLNGAHLLPDGSGALVWPKEHLIALADPLTNTSTPRAAAARLPALFKILATVLNRRRPRAVLWLGETLPRLYRDGLLGKTEAKALTAMLAAHDWVWVEAAAYQRGPLTFRATASAETPIGEVAGGLAPVARLRRGEDSETRPCYVFDGRRLLLPAFGSDGTGTDVLSPALKPLFRRPFAALMVSGGRIKTMTRAQLEAQFPRQSPAAAAATGRVGTRMKLGSGE
ncbi:conserved hypothetical protein [Candidatus Terasakiella magnetica]|nr:conserved hypothetical protein [Candidatus Terasakiella magnetica]